MAARKTNEEPLKQVIERFLKLYKLDSKMNQVRIRDEWKNLLGSMIDKRTEEIKLHNSILYVKLNSAPLRNELSMAKSRLIEKINKQMNSTVVKDIYFK